ncbi:hypothetical protein [Ruegeria arenilitoris]|uniref:hypothetical protein n=1 Tax=Ruegeria arenilitoris TaxID=1173585 RepID=UPI00147AEECF|nr:hypothetical protein [Ruegeria arenilitoris]
MKGGLEQSLSSIFEKDRISRFAKQVKPGVLPKLGIEPIDSLLGFPAEHLPKDSDQSDQPEEIRALGTNLKNLSDRMFCFRV